MAPRYPHTDHLTDYLTDHLTYPKAYPRSGPRLLCIMECSPWS